VVSLDEKVLLGIGWTLNLVLLSGELGEMLGGFVEHELNQEKDSAEGSFREY